VESSLPRPSARGLGPTRPVGSAGSAAGPGRPAAVVEGGDARRGTRSGRTRLEGISRLGHDR